MARPKKRTGQGSTKRRRPSRQQRQKAATKEAPAGAPIGDTTTGKLRDAVALAMAKMSSQGSVPAATALLKVLEGAEEAHAAQAHQERLEALEGDTEGLARYLGELGVERLELESRLRRPATPEEMHAWRAGHRDRALEVRALELRALRAHGGKPAEWMRRKP
jgi:hypothetical protein